MILSLSTRLMRRLAFAAFAALVFPISLYGQMGNDNPLESPAFQWQTSLPLVPTIHTRVTLPLYH